jgi:hypothetical protein
MHRCGPYCFYSSDIHACALSAHTCVRVSVSASATHLELAATPLSLPGAGTINSDIHGLIVLHVDMIRGINGIRDLTQCRGSFLGTPLMVPLKTPSIGYQNSSSPEDCHIYIIE